MIKIYKNLSLLQLGDNKDKLKTVIENKNKTNYNQLLTSMHQLHYAILNEIDWDKVSSKKNTNVKNSISYSLDELKELCKRLNIEISRYNRSKEQICIKLLELKVRYDMELQIKNS